MRIPLPRRRAQCREDGAKVHLLYGRGSHLRPRFSIPAKDAVDVLILALVGFLVDGAEVTPEVLTVRADAAMVPVVRKRGSVSSCIGGVAIDGVQFLDRAHVVIAALVVEGAVGIPAAHKVQLVTPDVAGPVRDRMRGMVR